MKGSPFLSGGRPTARGGGRLVLPVVLSATFVQLLNVTVAQIAAPAIQADLGAGAGAVQLILAGYTLAYACLLLTAARLGDRYGYHRLFVLGTVVFIAGSVASACAPDATFLIAARLVQGAGSGLAAPQVLSIIQVAVPAARRPRALGLFGATMGVASLAGPLIGGLLVGADLVGLGWRSAFLVTVPVALVSLAGAPVLPRTRGAAGQAMGARMAELDRMRVMTEVIDGLATEHRAGFPSWMPAEAVPTPACRFCSLSSFAASWTPVPGR